MKVLSYTTYNHVESTMFGSLDNLVELQQFISPSAPVRILPEPVRHAENELEVEIENDPQNVIQLNITAMLMKSQVQLPDGSE